MAPMRTACGLKAAWLLVVVCAFLFLPSCAYLQELSQEERGQPRASNAPKYWEQAMAYRQAGDLPAAAQELEKAVRADPEMYHAYYMLGLIYRNLGLTEKAKKTWERGVDKARVGLERKDYPRERALAQMRAGLAGLTPPPEPSQVQSRELKPRPPAAPSAAKPRSGEWAVLYSSNLEARHAARDKARLDAMGLETMLQTVWLKKKKWHRVWVGCCGSRAQARTQLLSLRARGIKGQLTVMKPGK